MKYAFEELLSRRFCEARTRKGTPCQRLDIYWNGRCRLNGRDRGDDFRSVCTSMKQEVASVKALVLLVLVHQAS
ncbi:HGGxSTG domain-containing protein [uncultured Desulfobulbus sp.]|uniref:HGGxSTG domain-containing protein n=1 Tax=uncultured Desulfobulbus sp. TaxID=239745 RepID=UPI0029C6CD5C|nr:HGGxSTG domain-containing protein [uncultured Desulfobulbus sp.]